MPRRTVSLTHRKQRPVLTDMLPFEVPPTFSNRGFYRFLREHGVEIVDNHVRWISDTPGTVVAMSLLFGFDVTNVIVAPACIEWGRRVVRQSVSLKVCTLDTIPFSFRVAHRLEGRTLSVVHPRNQVQMAGFYTNYSALITYYSSLSEFSIRRPVAVSRVAYVRDYLHDQRLERLPVGVEKEDREYEQLGSYFVYKHYRNIHRFFESWQYHRCEKKYTAMVQVDISKCFDSIYTHSLSWAVIGKDQTKCHLREAERTFGARFDRIMQRLNDRETNGIVIGPEFSRVFAEIILQSVDVRLRGRLFGDSGLRHKIDYEAFRYVDDYFVFYNEPSSKLKIIDTLQEILKHYKLSINPAKLKEYEKPIITEITVAKERVSTLLNDHNDPRSEVLGEEEPGEPPARSLTSK